MKVSLVTRNGKPITVGAGPHCFPIKDDKLVHSEDQRIGSEVNGTLDVYNAAYEFAEWAWRNRLFDDVEKH